MLATPVHRTIVVLDIEQYGHPNRDDLTRVHLRQVLHQLVADTLVGTGAASSQWTATSTGDGLLVLVEPEVAKAAVVRAVLDPFHHGLIKHNRLVTELARFRVRVVVHAGELLLDAQGAAGEQINLACRLLDSDELRACLKVADGPLVLGVSEQPIYQQVVRQRHLGLDPRAFEPVQVVVKETRARLWVCAPSRPQVAAAAGVLAIGEAIDRSYSPAWRMKGANAAGNGRVFLSLVPRVLEIHRARLVQRLRADGWNLGFSEFANTASIVAPFNLRFEELRRSDVVIVLLGPSTNSPLDQQSLALTEADVLEAERLGKPLLVYDYVPLHPQPAPGGAVDSLLDSLRTHLYDELTGHLTARLTDANELCDLVVNNLRERYTVSMAAGTLWFLRLSSILQQTQTLSMPLEPAQLDYVNDTLTAALDVCDYKNAEAICAQFGHEFIRRTNVFELWPIIDHFYDAFHHVLALRGRLVLGKLSAESVAKAHRQGALLVGDLSGAVRATAALSGLLSMAGRLDSARRWAEWASVRQEALVDKAPVYDSLAALEQARGEIELSYRHTLLAADIHDGPPEVRGYMLGRAAELDLLRPGRGPDHAFDRFDEALRIANRGLSRVCVLVAGVRIALAGGEVETARDLHRQAVKICRQNGLRVPQSNLAKIAAASGLYE